jgi:ATP/maltotriose-dependent transcriptional regulator MalT
VSPARGPPTDWAELVQAHDDRDLFQTSHAELPIIDLSLEIGRELGIVERTVKCHVTAILAKLGAHDRAGAVARGFDLAILEAARERT